MSKNNHNQVSIPENLGPSIAAQRSLGRNALTAAMEHIPVLGKKVKQERLAAEKEMERQLEQPLLKAMAQRIITDLPSEGIVSRTQNKGNNNVTTDYTAVYRTPGGEQLIADIFITESETFKSVSLGIRDYGLGVGNNRSLQLQRNIEEGVAYKATGPMTRANLGGLPVGFTPHLGHTQKVDLLHEFLGATLDEQETETIHQRLLDGEESFNKNGEPRTSLTTIHRARDFHTHPMEIEFDPMQEM